MLCDCDCDCDCDSGCGQCNARCDTPCNVCQSFCEVGKQNASQNGMGYSFGPFNRDDIIIKVMPQSVFNAMGEAVEKMANYGSSHDSWGWTWTPETRDFIYADKVNELIRGIESLRGGTTVQGVPRPITKDIDIVYGQYFTAIANAINSMKLYWNACNMCDSGCDAKCDDCNICQSCYTCLTEGGSGSGCDCDS